jgi:hypothetical protein
MFSEERELEKLQAAKVARRRWFGVSMMVLACVCFAIASMPWPSKQALDLGMWMCFGVTLLLVGAWQIDKAGKETISAAAGAASMPPDASPPDPSGIRRVK